ncbi:MAG: hypothetical protein QNJ09_06920 [Paracoccaceae bacterium]|nr:hypothetical protein [Paracoccaceae bacterium]
MKKFFGTLIGLGLAGFGVIAYVGQAGMAERSGNVDDLYAGMVMGGLLVFAGVLTLWAVFRKPKKPADPAAAAATVWAVGMTTLGDDDMDFDGD